MQKRELERFRNQLQNSLASLRQTAMSHRQQMDENSESKDFVGGDKAQELETLEVDTQIAEGDENLARKIQHALERIDEGTYGVCEDCGGDIPLARLEVKPSVSLCVPCQEKHEASN